MGIQDLYAVIEERCPDQLGVAKLTDLAGYRIAVDISVFLYKYIRSSGFVEWMNTFTVFLVTLRNSGVTAICVFDGPNPPPEKALEQERRRAQTDRSTHRLRECKRLREIVLKQHCPDDLPVTGTLRKECHELIYGSRGAARANTNYDDPYDVLQGLNVTIARLDRQTLPITTEHKERAKKLVRLMGLACLEADGEAESMCAHLAVDGQVDGVLTEDTDVLAYGTPYMFAFKSFKLGDNKVHVLCLASILEELGMTYEEFRDLCILLGCDYNARVSGYPPDGKKYKKAVPIGFKGALAMIDEYRRLEEVCKYVDDDGPLNYRRCRELFTVPTIVPKIQPYQQIGDVADIETFFKANGITISVDYVLKPWKCPEIHFEGIEEDVEEDIVEGTVENVLDVLEGTLDDGDGDDDDGDDDGDGDDTIDFFRENEPHGALSNFWREPIVWRGRTYASAEHLYQSRKYNYDGASAASRAYAEVIRLASTPYKAKVLARDGTRGGTKCDNDTKIAIMREVLREKYRQCKHARNVLRATGNMRLVERSEYDPFWGKGMNGKGENWLGRLLEEVRATL